MPANEEISEMERLNKIMEGDLGAAKEDTPLKSGMENSSNSASDPTISNPGQPTSEDVKAMEGILERFNGNIAPSLVDEAKSNSQLNEALNTEPTDDGFKIGDWEIKKIVKEGITRKDEVFYKVKQSSSGNNINATLKLHESAKSLVNMLNANFKFDHPKVKEVVELDEEYQRLRQKALEEKKRWAGVKNTDLEWKQDLYEAKFDSAKSRAMYIKERVKNILLQSE